MTIYAELQCISNFSFLRGGSHPQELVETAHELGLAAIAIADHNSLAGAVRAHIAAKTCGIRLVVGSRIVLRDGPDMLVYPTDRAAYGRLCRLLTLGKRRAEKGQCLLHRADLEPHIDGQIVIVVPPAGAGPDQSGPDQSVPDQSVPDALAHLRRLNRDVFLAGHHLYRGDDRRRLARLAAIADQCGTPLVATNDVHYHAPERRPLQDVLTSIREKCRIAEAGFRLHANAERHLKTPAEMARLFADHPGAVARTVEIAEACTFSLDELIYEYPDEPVPAGVTPQAHLEALTRAGAAERYPDGVPAKVRHTLERELKLIGKLGYAPYFLTVHDIVRYARSQGILCQGRGSAANSAVCYVIGITAVDPARIDLLFERFVSEARKEPPDIDVDFEHERREEVIQYIYRRYGRERAGIAATIISYRPRSAVREVGKAMGLSGDVTSALAKTVWGSWGSGVDDKHIREAGLDPADPTLARTIALATELLGFPRHLSQHVGGFVLTRGPLEETVPIGNGAMAERTFIEWDKDDIDALGILKVDVLGLGMLTCIRKGFELIRAHYGRELTLANVPPEDPAVYDMLCAADAVGVFQVESRAQMNMLPRLKPREFYDLVIEVAIVRPGPIQGDMVHPYLRRRDGIEKVEYPSPAPQHGPEDELRRVLGKTLGVPLFQEQAMRIAIEAARFSPDEANQLRRAMATFRRVGTIGTLQDKMVQRMIGRGYDADFARRCFDQIKGFGEYGFPESHAASFALLVYVSAWLKRHYPDVFCAALLNAQPMGFYAPAQIVRDAREHGIEVRPPDVNFSEWDNGLEAMGGSTAAAPTPNPSPQGGGGPGCAVPDGRCLPTGYEKRRFSTHAASTESSPPPCGEGLGVGGVAPCRFAVRLGLRQIDGLGEAVAEAIVAGRAEPFRSMADVRARSGLSPAMLERLAAADAFRSIGLDRRQALWEVRALPAAAPLPLFAAAGLEGEGADEAVRLPEMPLSEHVVADYQTQRLSLKAHPMHFLRERYRARGIVAAGDVGKIGDNRWLRIAGVVLIRQRPGSAKGVVFMTLEDETGVANAVVWPKTLETFRKVVMGARLILIHGRIQRHKEITHIVAHRLEDLSGDLAVLSQDADMPAPLARADEVRRPGADMRGHPRNARIIPKSRDFH